MIGYKNFLEGSGKTGYRIGMSIAGKWRLLIVCVLLFSIWLCGFGVPSARAQDAVLSFVPDASEIDCHETVTVDIVIDDAATDLHGFSLVLEFDSSIIEPYQVSAGDLILDAPCDHYLIWRSQGAVSDSVAVDVATLGCAVDGPGTIMQVVFGGVGPGTSFLRCRAGLFRNSLNLPIAVTCGEATITNVCPTAAATISWGSLKYVYR